MKQAALTSGRLSLYNLRRRPFRTACLIIVVFILAMTLFGGSVLINRLQSGMAHIEERLGADIMVVPPGQESKLEGILLQGEPGYFYFDKTVERKIAQVEGVSQVSSQYYLTSLSAACCSAAVQFVGFDPETDFATRPWIEKAYGSGIGDGQIVAGGDITLDTGNTLKFFNYIYPVAAQLGKTSTGMDTSVFMTMDTMKELIGRAHEAGMNFLAEGEPGESVSSVLVKLEQGFDADAVAKSIRASIPDVSVVVSKSMLSGISARLESLVVYIYTISAVFWILSAVVLAVVFSVTIGERKKELAIFRILGATRKKLIGIVLTEALFTSAAGSIAGAAAAALIVFPFSAYIGRRLQLPYPAPPAGAVLGLLALGLLLSAVVGPIAAVYAAVKISRAETYVTMREGE
ncbi:MAG: FtsX-like permease family protein [Clostridiales bacterium]|nr:FtsX-like permease family protein [Clostridiales bacterium]